MKHLNSMSHAKKNNLRAISSRNSSHGVQYSLLDVAGDDIIRERPDKKKQQQVYEQSIGHRLSKEEFNEYWQTSWDKWLMNPPNLSGYE